MILLAASMGAFVVADYTVKAIAGHLLVPRPLGAFALIVGCTLLLLAEGHRRFDRCERALLERDLKRDMADAGLGERHGHLRSVNEDH